MGRLERRRHGPEAEGNGLDSYSVERRRQEGVRRGWSESEMKRVRRGQPCRSLLHTVSINAVYLSMYARPLPSPQSIITLRNITMWLL